MHANNIKICHIYFNIGFYITAITIQNLSLKLNFYKEKQQRKF
jgi:hypothetical protein